MQEHRGEEGNYDGRKRIPRRAPQKYREMVRNYSELMYQHVQTSRIQRPFKEKNHHVQNNKKSGHERSAVSRLVVADGQHRRSVNLVTCNLTRRSPALTPQA